ncbi:polyprenyl synthetase family protein [Candidatus Micrarchaeota archaeon]|nr:polyprenyl synthetase family protein [Candidatus Micrarchaeota archaeon]
MDARDYIGEKSRTLEGRIYGEIPKEPRFIYSMLEEFISRGGKRIRPILTIACAEACGGKEEDAMPYALAIELFHNFTLVHDDIEDASPMRRGKPTLHEQFGTPIAINSGDALYTVVWSSLLSKNIPPEKFAEASKILIKGFSAVVEGQGTELEWYRINKFDVSEEDYFKMAGGKTGSLIGISCQIGAFAAGAPRQVQDSLSEFGEKIGLAFQIKDDILNLTADPEKYKKEIGEDIKEGKRSLIMLKLLSVLDRGEKERVISILAKPEKSEEEVSKLIELAKEKGAIAYAQEVSDGLIGEAKARLQTLDSESGRETLLMLADYIVRRQK